MVDDFRHVTIDELISFSSGLDPGEVEYIIDRLVQTQTFMPDDAVVLRFFLFTVNATEFENFRKQADER